MDRIESLHMELSEQLNINQCNVSGCQISPRPMSGPSSSVVKAALPYGWLGDCQGEVAVPFKRGLSFYKWNASRFCVSSLRRGHANLLCIVPILVYVPPKRVRRVTSAGSIYTCMMAADRITPASARETARDSQQG